MRIHLTALLLLCCARVVGAHDEVTPKPKLLQNAVPMRKLSVEESDQRVFSFTVPPGTNDLVVQTRGGSGDCDLYVRRGAHPTTLRFDRTSRQSGNRETIRIENPAPGPWYVLLDAFNAFTGVELTATAHLQRGAIPAPTLFPGPGVFAGYANVRLKRTTGRTTLRYTIDGSEPTMLSEPYTKPLNLATTYDLRVKAFRADGTSGPEASGWYVIVPQEQVTPLVSGQVVHHRAGDAGTTHLFKISVPAGQPQLQVRVEGGPGETELLVQKGSIPTRQSFAFRGKRRGQSSSVDVPNPGAGEWFISLRGRTAFSNHSVLAFVRPQLPDLIAWQPVLDPYLSTESFTDSDCEVAEGMITSGTHRLLRFSTETRNLGATDLSLPDPVGNPNFEYQECHGHYHFKGFASYRLLDGEGHEVATGRKVSFCLEDIARWDPSGSPDSRYTCEAQGIQSGWADIYDAGLPGQWIDVTGLPPGTYTLEVTMNPDHILEEADYTNNTATIEVEIGATDG